MAAHAPASYFQHASKPGGHMVAHVNPAYFQPGVLASARNHGSLAHGRNSHGRSGVTKHGRGGGVHGRRHESPMPTVQDPWKHKGMGRNKR